MKMIDKSKISFSYALAEIKGSKGSRFFALMVLVWLLPMGSILCVALLFVRFFTQLKNYLKRKN